MVEPFSLASGAAGVVSLGLTVCQGLLAYYGPFKAFSSETEAFVTRINGLSAILELLQAKLNKLQNPPSPHILDELQLVSDRLNECGETLQQLSNVLNKCQGYDAGGTLKKKGRAFAKALYPFRRGTLVGLLDVVAGIQSNLEVALQVLMLAITGQLEQQSSVSLSVSHSIASDIAGVPSSLKRLDTGQQRLMQSQEQMLQLVTRMQHMQLVALDQTPNVQQKFLMRQLPLHGSRHRHSWHKEPVRHFSRLGRSTASRAQCTCDGTRSWASRIIGFISSIDSHRYDCPLFHRREVATLLGGKLTILTRYINYSASFHVAIVHDTTAFSIQPTITFRRVVNPDSPVFKTIENLLCTKNKNYGNILLHLRHLFDEGKASPSDTLPNGRTLVHQAICFLPVIPVSKVPSFLQFVTELVIQYHVPVNDSFYSHTPLDLLMLYSDALTVVTCGVNMPDMRPKASQSFAAADFAHARLATLLLENGATVTLNSPPDQGPFCWPENPWGIRPFKLGCQNDYLFGMVKLCGIEEFPFSEPMKAILSRSENSLEAFLQTANQRDILDDVQSHQYIVAWPAGVEIILKYFPTHLAPRLLRRAILETQVQSLEILLKDHRCPVTHNDVAAAVRLSFTLNFHNTAIFQALVSAFAAQMQALKVLATTYLPLPESQRIGARYSKTLLDSEAWEVQRLLFKAECPLAADMAHHEDLSGDNMGKRSVYHELGCNKQAAEILYRAGFTNVDEINASGHSPLLLLRPPSLWENSDGPRDYLEIHLEETFAPTIIRTCTFNILGLTHTCRGHDPEDWQDGKVSVTDVPTIQEEERFLIALLEDLVAEFVRKYQEEQVLLADFLENYWVSRINEILEEENVYDEQEAARMREVTKHAVLEVEEDEEEENNEHSGY
ncbi:uncharacterized protein BDV14DRAFT_199554 [Aspergillus stella-maris]|uniref:uncharacterized protein n=1 Tax=Aspergillus stella-maris TaxID=1810926 RepID=UPI003CCCA788